MPQDQGGEGVRRRAHKLNKAFKILDLSESQGHALVAAKKIKVIRLGPRSPRVTTEEIDRILREGIG
jgi:hypothetical protein